MATDDGRQPDPADRTATGRWIVDCYCPECSEYSGGGLCRVCSREIEFEIGKHGPGEPAPAPAAVDPEFAAPEPKPAPDGQQRPLI